VFLVADVIYLPVESSETRVTADDETYTLIAAYTEWTSKINTHHIVGWYHSHPSFGCWLSGIDVNTQELFQKNTDPFLAIVVDPIKSANLRTLFLN
jgi:COP9 signalosome complex subunit 5